MLFICWIHLINPTHCLFPYPHSKAPPGSLSCIFGLMLIKSRCIRPNCQQKTYNPLVLWAPPSRVKTYQPIPVSCLSGQNWEQAPWTPPPCQLGGRSNCPVQTRPQCLPGPAQTRTKDVRTPRTIAALPSITQHVNRPWHSCSYEALPQSFRQHSRRSCRGRWPSLSIHSGGV